MSVKSLLFQENGDISFVKNRLTSNNGNNGGAIEATGTIDFVLNNNLLFTGNVAQSGGAIYSEDAITFSQNVGDILFQDNTARYGGGAIYTKKSARISRQGVSSYYQGGKLCFLLQ